MFCNKCGNYFDDKTESRFCSKCGNDLSKMREAGKTEEVVVPQEPEVKQRVLSKEQYRENGNKLRLAIILSCLGGMLLAVLFTVFVVILPIVNFVGDTIDKANEALDSKPNFDFEDDNDLPSNWSFGEEEEDQDKDKEQEKDNDSENIKIKDSDTKRVGSDEFGYVSVPTYWVENGYASGEDYIQYTSIEAEDMCILTVFGVAVDSKAYADAMYETFEGYGVVDLKMDTVDVGKYKNCYFLTGKYEEQGLYLNCWFIEDDEGYTHYIALEGKNKNSEYFTEIIKTFAEDK